MPPDMFIQADKGLGTTTVYWNVPIADDDDGAVTLTSNYSPGDSLPVGVTVVTYHAVDINGNYVNASFTITVGGKVFLLDFLFFAYRPVRVQRYFPMTSSLRCRISVTFN